MRNLLPDRSKLSFSFWLLPDLSGVQIYHSVVEKRPSLLPRFVVMTGGAVSDESRLFLDDYEGPILNKPFTLSQVEKLVTSLLGSPAQAAQINP